MKISNRILKYIFAFFTSCSLLAAGNSYAGRDIYFLVLFPPNAKNSNQQYVGIQTANSQCMYGVDDRKSYLWAVKRDDSTRFNLETQASGLDCWDSESKTTLIFKDNNGEIDKVYIRSNMTNITCNSDKGKVSAQMADNANKYLCTMQIN